MVGSNPLVRQDSFRTLGQPTLVDVLYDFFFEPRSRKTTVEYKRENPVIRIPSHLDLIIESIGRSDHDKEEMQVVRWKDMGWRRYVIEFGQPGLSLAIWVKVGIPLRYKFRMSNESIILYFDKVMKERGWSWNLNTILSWLTRSWSSHSSHSEYIPLIISH